MRWKPAVPPHSISRNLMHSKDFDRSCLLVNGSGLGKADCVRNNRKLKEQDDDYPDATRSDTASNTPPAFRQMRLDGVGCRDLQTVRL
jgi:hypothetical protein